MTMRRIVLVALLIVSGMTGDVGLATAAGAEGDETYQIGSEDVLDIAVWSHAELGRTVPVRPDGKISLPLINDVQAAGHTAMSLRELLIKRFSEFIPTPEVSVIVKEIRSFKVTIIGQIKTPGRYEFRSRTTVLDAIAQAGAFTNFAATSRIFVLRPNGSGMRQIPFNYKRIVAMKGDHENFFLEPGDIIVVP
jgi:polysaccharide export outer membrane protein